MKQLISKLNKAFDHRIRLGIMSSLIVNEGLSFSELKQLLDVTDGNLASHLKALEKEGYILVTKKFVDRKPNTSYKVSAGGKKAFQAHINELENLIKNTK